MKCIIYILKNKEESQYDNKQKLRGELEASDSTSHETKKHGPSYTFVCSYSSLLSAAEKPSWNNDEARKLFRLLWFPCDS